MLKTLIFQTINFVITNLKYQSFTPSGSKDIGIRKFELVATTLRINALLIPHLKVYMKGMSTMIKESFNMQIYIIWRSKPEPKIHNS